MIALFDRIWIELIIVLALLLIYLRGKFRKELTHTDSWTVYFKPNTWHEFKALFSNTFSGNENYLMARNAYRTALLIYVVVIVLLIVFHLPRKKETPKGSSGVPELILPKREKTTTVAAFTSGKNQSISPLSPTNI